MCLEADSNVKSEASESFDETWKTPDVGSSG